MKDEFRSWHDGESRKLWIHSRPAAGKTYLAKYIISCVPAEEGVRVVNCFLDGRLKERSSCDAIFRSTIHQLATIHPSIWNDPVLWGKHSLSSKEVDKPGVRRADGTAASWTRKELRSLWKDMVAPAATNNNGLIIIIDGFDDIPANDQEDFLHCLEECEKELSGGVRPDLRILVLSRWCLSLGNRPRGFVAYEIGEQDNFQDIYRTMEIELSRFAGVAQYSDDFQKVVCDKVARGANGIYLWATVVMAHIGIEMPGERQLQEQLDELPKRLAELFDSILGKIISSRGDSAGPIVRRVLLWVVYGLEPLELQELNLGLTLAKLWGKAPNKPIDTKLLEKHMIRPEIFKASLITLCGQLLSFSSSNHVNPVHRTLTQYLTTPPDTYKDDEHEGWVVPNHDDFYVDEHKAHASLGNMCAAYLIMPSFADAGERYQPTDDGRARWEVKVRTRIEGDPLVKYAALCWSRHFRAAGLAEEREVLVKLHDMKSGFGICWFEVWWFARKWRGLPFPETDEKIEGLMLDAEQTENSLVPPEEQAKRQAEQKPREPIEPIEPGRTTGPTEPTEPGGTTENPRETTEKPTESTDKPTETTEKPTEPTEKTTEITEEPTEQVTEKLTGKPPQQPTGQPTEHPAEHPAEHPTGPLPEDQSSSNTSQGRPTSPESSIVEQPSSQTPEGPVLSRPRPGRSGGIRNFSWDRSRPPRMPVKDPRPNPIPVANPSPPSSTPAMEGDNQPVAETPARSEPTPPTPQNVTPTRITPPPPYGRADIEQAPPLDQTPPLAQQTGKPPAPPNPQGKLPSDGAAGTHARREPCPRRMTWSERLCRILTCGCYRPGQRSR